MRRGEPREAHGSGGVALPQSATLVCGAAEALARWATEAQAASESELGAPLKAIAIGTSYECRGQNHDPDAKLSEHAYANGIDVMSFSVDGRAPISVVAAPDGTPEARFLATVRARACGFFRTVLGRAPMRRTPTTCTSTSASAARPPSVPMSGGTL
ncbi:extensin family protein [Methylobacterium durans]|uniref:extensin family protein n=1 Tax=Methylobacterium durans TaxID=2202825 RepID=UPI0026977D19